MPVTNRQWLLAKRPQGMVKESNFRYQETSLPEPDTKAGQLLVRNLWFSFDPAMRTWMDATPTYLPPSPLDEPMRAVSLARVEKSENPSFPRGSLVQGMFGWQDYVVADPAGLTAPATVPPDAAPEAILGVLGGTGVTAWCGLLQTGQLQAGETVLVSAAAGATGSVAAQLARLKGCRSIGIAGGREKCEWLLRDCRLDAAIDYQNEDTAERLASLCPEGVNLFFDNVGGAILEAAIDHMAERGRIVLCGQIASYNNKKEEQGGGPGNLIQLVLRRVSMEGFLMLDYLEYMGQAQQELAAWVKAGEIACRNDVQEGFQNIPRTLLRLFRGENQGKQLLKNDAPD